MSFTLRNNRVRRPGVLCSPLDGCSNVRDTLFWATDAGGRRGVESQIANVRRLHRPLLETAVSTATQIPEA